MNVDRVLERANVEGRTTRLYRLWVKGQPTNVARYFDPAATGERQDAITQLAYRGAIGAVWNAEWKLEE